MINIVQTFASALILLPLIMFCYALLTRVIKSKNYSKSLSQLAIGAQLLIFLVSVVLFGMVFLKGPYTEHLFPWIQHTRPVYNLQVHLDYDNIYFLILSALISGIIGKFSINYLAYEEGYYKFFINFYLMQLGLYTLIITSNFYFVLISWELLGLASVFLISFYQSNHKTVSNSLFVMGIYKFCDLFLILALLLFHHEQNSFLIGSLPGVSNIFLVSLIIASMGKSAIFPFSKWVPRAMEGPTTTSAVFYGALSIHAGIILLMKFQSVFKAYPYANYLIFLLGLLTAIYANLKSRIQTDVKSTLAYGTVVQVGLIYMEFALGWYPLVVFHTISNALLKTYQFSCSPSNIHHFHNLEKLNKQTFASTGLHFERLLPAVYRQLAYKIVYHNFGLTLLWESLILPFKQFQNWADSKFERFNQTLLDIKPFRSQAFVLVLGVLTVLLLMTLEIFKVINPLYLSAALLCGALLMSFLSLKHTTITQYLIKIKTSYFLVSAGAMLTFGRPENSHATIYFLLNLVSLFILDYFIKYLSRRLNLEDIRFYLGIGNRYKYISMIAIAILLTLTFTPGFASFIIFDIILEDLSEHSTLIMLLFLGVNILNMYSFFKFMFKLLFGETQKHLNEYPDFSPIERIKLACLILPMVIAGVIPFL